MTTQIHFILMARPKVPDRQIACKPLSDRRILWVSAYDEVQLFGSIQLPGFVAVAIFMRPF